MGHMTEATFEILYEYGKRVYKEEIDINSAGKAVNQSNSEVAISSAIHYINWYSKMRVGDFLSWNTNRSLLIYYVNRIITEDTSDVAKLAIKAARKYASFKNLNDLDEELKNIANEHGLSLLSLEDLNSGNSINEWRPSIDEYKPKITKEKWLELLNNKDIFQNKHLLAMACMYDNGGEGSCSELGEKYNQKMALWRTSCGAHLASKIATYTKCPLMKDGDKPIYFVIPFLYRETASDELGSYIYRLRPELYDALTEFGIEKYLPHQTRIFDSWEIIDEGTAIKTCDKSFFEHNESGIPKGIGWYFDADDCKPGDRIDIKLKYKGNTYNARVSNESSDRRRIRIFWESNLGKEFKSKRNIEGIKLRFIKESVGKYSIDFIADSSTNNSTKTNTWLLTWNPKNWEWKNFDFNKKTIANGGECIDEWACSNSHVKLGDRIFMTMLGMSDENGIFASGTVVKEPYQALHYDEEKKKQGITIQKVDVKFDALFDYKKEKILKQTQLNNMFPDQRWNPQGSGIEIKAIYRNKLEEEWAKLTGKDEIVTMTNKEILNTVKSFISSKGFTYPDNLIENFYLSLKSKPFVILAGTSGTGKTRLVRLFAEAIGATTENGQYELVPVRPDWSDSSDLFGHINLKGEFIEGPITKFIKKAKENRNKPYILCLDEMNLARVEYYFSDFLSIMETRDRNKAGDEIISNILFENEKCDPLYFYPNLYVIGTVNMDETTFPFSKKVLDRANTIEFNYVSLNNPTFDDINANCIDVSNDFLVTKYLKLKECKDEAEYINKICTKLEKINQILAKANLHVGYRVRDEIVFYMLNNKHIELLDENEALDYQIMQKILPRIQGSSDLIKNVLDELIKHFKGNIEDNSENSETKQKTKFPNCVAKLKMMATRFEDEGFTSYWV